MTLDPALPRLKPALASGDPVGAVWFTLGQPALVEVACRHGPDAVVIDMQHGLFERLSLEAAVGVSRAPVIVRTRDHHPASIGEALDAGAEGVIVPLVETADTALAVAQACRYPPQGSRSGGGIRPQADFPAHVRGANDAVVAGVMIETARGVEEAEAIARSGVDLVFIGTGDLALSLGSAPGEELHEAACRRVLEACSAAGIPCGAFAMDDQGALWRARQGFALTVVAIDMNAFQGAVGSGIARFREAGKPLAEGEAVPKASRAADKAAAPAAKRARAPAKVEKPKPAGSGAAGKPAGAGAAAKPATTGGKKSRATEARERRRGKEPTGAPRGRRN